MDLVMFEEEFEQLQGIIGRLQVDSASKVVFLVDKNGQQIASSGDVRSIDATSLALVRLRVKKASRDLNGIFERVEERAQDQANEEARFASPFSEITDEDIDKLFGD